MNFGVNRAQSSVKHRNFYHLEHCEIDMSLQRGYRLTKPIILQTGQDTHAKVHKKVKQFRMKFYSM